MNKRRYPRMNGKNLRFDISDGSGFFSGYVSDISRFGILLDDIPLKLDHSAKTLSLVVSGNGKNFKMMAIPKWTVEKGISKTIGMELINVPYIWAGFIREFAPKTSLTHP
ncbi:PilZ domain-containing protein [Desulfotalea psychrophila]|uniref:PilZ domain-containing protein n=1 Tax=Desulfotalea psychrophila (strain LSv54 / DSM 12343) TaxID=177439 RepID=Q6ARX4_DESPS|nr:PilZ domain-containing protein [Desulfotalea psychrophila]CAG34901.1 unknown protein [Desulfotalea psychrophila LSv54]